MVRVVLDWHAIVTNDLLPVVFEDALAITTLIRPHLARALLGWVPRKAGLTDGLEMYYAAWKAHSSK